MCGIFGYVKGVKEVDEEALRGRVRRLFVASQMRGRDATGYGYLGDNGLVIHKEPVPAKEFIPCLKDVPFGNIDVFLGHTRAATHGSTENSENNHPIVSKDSGIALIHNGVISSQKDLRTDGEVDSELILRLIELRLDVVEGIRFAEKNYTGTAAYAFIGTEFPNKVYLVRSGNPIWLAYVKEWDMVFFASTKEMLRIAFSSYEFKFGYFAQRTEDYTLMYKEMADNSWLSIKKRTKKGISIREGVTEREHKKKEPAIRFRHNIDLSDWVSKIRDHNKRGCKR